ncbi:helix-turn-helix domain-containing protein [Bifidobacterium miconisargentati]|uniref:helix-turn-helix domain-containing protein n=1 Tax=Bifidobacterium miconisargentati TaxID=2834437 RepID=UPI001BDC09DC|nr:helix-turn-helix domain-containing protein [Bifidobacterium miconisargentati]MBW3089196.1 helix-turn-helix transcriptional regulator [Bifidobacterium miconisargentati]
MLRELLGLSQSWVAKHAGVSLPTLKNWENPDYFYPPKREAWDLLEGLWRQADAKAAGLVDIASEAARTARERGVEPAPIVLTYWRGVKDFEKRFDNGDEGSFRIANAATRLAADRLHALGLPVTVMYAESE